MKYISFLISTSSYKEDEILSHLKQEIQKLQYYTIQKLKTKSMKHKEDYQHKIFKIVKQFNEEIENVL